MKKSWIFTACMIPLLLFSTACSPTEEAPDSNLSAPEELSEESLMEESIMEDSITEDSIVEDSITEDTITEEINDETAVNESQVLQEPDNPYRNTSESYGGSWMEALYEMHKEVPELETGKIIFAFCAEPKEDFSHPFPFNRQVILPYFWEAETEPALRKIQQYYSEQNWTLSQEEMENYENYIKSDNISGVDEYNLWRVYRQERFITVVFESFSTWGRGRSDPYADVFWTETGEHVTFADLFKGKEAELLQALVENGRQIPLGCVLEEWESWEFLFDDAIYAKTLPSRIDSSFYPTPLGMVFSYYTLEIGCRAEGTILVFLDWASLEGICKLPDT